MIYIKKTKYLGLDLGSKTIGISISDDTKTIATTYQTLRYNSEEHAVLELKKIIEEENIEKVILGFPRNMNYSIGPKGEKTLEFKKKLESLNVNVIVQDERLSTVEATNYLVEANLSRKKRKKVVDAVAANIILQSYLDKERGNFYGRKNNI